MNVTIKNTSGERQRGPFHLVEPGEVFVASARWAQARDDRFRRGQFTMVTETSEPKSPESCHGTTAAGKPCGAKPVEDSLFCRHHQPKSDEEE